MEICIWIFILLLPTLMQAADNEYEDDFVALLCDVNHNAHDDMNALERLKYVYSNHNIAYIKWASYDEKKNAIVARYKRYGKNFEDLFVKIEKSCISNEITIHSTKKVLHNTDETQVIECEADPKIISELKRDIALFELRFGNHKNRHYYCWEELSDIE